MINPGDWNFTDQRATKNRKVNTELDRLFKIVEQYQESCRILSKPIRIDELKRELSGMDNRETSNNNTFWSDIAHIIEQAKQGKVLHRTRGRYAPGSIKNWEKTIVKLREFDESMQFNNITMDTYMKFIQYCNAKKFTANYTGSLIKEWKTIMRIAHDHKLHSNLVFNDPKFKKLTEASSQVYLDDHEIEKLYKLDLSKDGMLEVIRDRFVINLYTGLRISDMRTLDSSNIQNELITHINQKTNKKVVIPVHPVVAQIIRKYKGLPYQYHQNTVNRVIKIICMRAKINDTVRYTKTVGGLPKEFIRKKYLLVTNHTCRRSMATNLLKDAEIQEAMPVMGMSVKTLMLYNKISPEENAQRLKQNKFFKK